MTGQELIDLIQRNCNLEDEVVLKDENSKTYSIMNVEIGIDRSPYDQDFDKRVTQIEISQD